MTYPNNNILFQYISTRNILSPAEEGLVQRMEETLKLNQIESERRLQSSQIESERRLQSSQKELKEDIKSSQIESERRMQTSQMELRDDMKRSQKSFESNIILKLTVYLSGAVIASVSIFEYFGFYTECPWRPKSQKGLTSESCFLSS
jgi:hypothetical protein